jgi:hypothetical protein
MAESKVRKSRAGIPELRRRTKAKSSTRLLQKAAPPELQASPEAPAPAKGSALWKGLGLVLLLACVFAGGVRVGLQQGWVEERDKHNGLATVKKHVQQLEDGSLVNHGLFEGYAEDGRTLLEKGEYFRGKKHGPWSLYYQDGKLAGQGSYDNGIPQQDWRYWDEQGKEIPEDQLPPATLDTPSTREERYPL